MSNPKRRPPIVGRYTQEELALATRNSGMPLEALRYDVTPAGLHYLLIHFDIPPADASNWRLRIDGRVAQPRAWSLAELESMPAKTLRVTLECAGNGRAQTSPRYPSMPWLEEGVSTAEWTGVPLSALLEQAGLEAGAREIVFHGTDRGIDRGIEHAFARSLPTVEAARAGVLVAYAMNGQPLLPQHGAPLRLVVPDWYGMASVKWLERIEATDRAFDGVQQALSYHFRRDAGAKGVPCTRMRVNSLMVPPGIPDYYGRRRNLAAGTVEILGRAWSGDGKITRVEFSADGRWQDATLDPPAGPHAWRRWTARWDAESGTHELCCRAADETGAIQPLEPVLDVTGFGNNAVQRVEVSVR
ncbi:MAG: sulfite oxidase [Candidatus Parcubacteria bacterium]|nr:sulfite oxidase [Burkholderiales bacterium]